MSLSFPTTLKSALARRAHVLVLAPSRAVRAGQPWKALFKGSLAAALGEMARTPPGDLGKVVTTWPAGKGAPRRVSLGVLPDRVSRHLSPTRAHAVAHVASKADLGARSVVIAQLDDASHWNAVANAVGRCVALYTRKTGKNGAADVAFVAVDAKGRVIPPPRAAGDMVEGARWAAAMVDRPTAELDTAMFVEEARAFLKGHASLRVKVIAGDALLKEGLRGLHAVGRAAEVPPRLLIVEHVPKKPRRVVALVGKGIVFDTGGLSLKPRDAMSGMKGDMGGGVAVLGALRALAAAGSPDHVVALVPLAENAIGPGAYRIDEILDMHSGKTVEINNTDAEGRLVLADACSYAVQHWKPAVIIDAATLTGAQLVATGKLHAGIVSNRSGLERLAVESGLRSGDTCFPMPFAPEIFQREFKSDVADMRNSVKDRANAQSACAAQFVWSHIESSGVPWLHVDLAGPAEADGRGTGYGVALMADIVASLEPEHLAAD